MCLASLAARKAVYVTWRGADEVRGSSSDNWEQIKSTTTSTWLANHLLQYA